MPRRHWKTTQAIVVTCELMSGKRRGGSYRIEFEYAVEGEVFRETFNAKKAMEPGQRFDLKYDPDDPETNERAKQMRHSRVLGFVIWFVFFVGCAVYAWTLLHE